jgi:hypothetical protein
MEEYRDKRHYVHRNKQKMTDVNPTLLALMFDVKGLG